MQANYVGDTRFSQQKVGLHQFEHLMQRICKEAGIGGYFTGHSGKVCEGVIYLQAVDLITTLFKRRVCLACINTLFYLGLHCTVMWDKG